MMKMKTIVAAALNRGKANNRCEGKHNVLPIIPHALKSEGFSKLALRLPLFLPPSSYIFFF